MTPPIRSFWTTFVFHKTSRHYLKIGTVCTLIGINASQILKSDILNNFTLLEVVWHTQWNGITGGKNGIFFLLSEIRKGCGKYDNKYIRLLYFQLVNKGKVPIGHCQHIVIIKKTSCNLPWITVTAEFPSPCPYAIDFSARDLFILVNNSHRLTVSIWTQICGWCWGCSGCQ